MGINLRHESLLPIKQYGFLMNCEEFKEYGSLLPYLLAARDKPQIIAKNPAEWWEHLTGFLHKVYKEYFIFLLKGCFFTFAYFASIERL